MNSEMKPFKREKSVKVDSKVITQLQHLTLIQAELSRQMVKDLDEVFYKVLSMASEGKISSYQDIADNKEDIEIFSYSRDAMSMDDDNVYTTVLKYSINYLGRRLGEIVCKSHFDKMTIEISFVPQSSKQFQEKAVSSLRGFNVWNN